MYRIGAFARLGHVTVKTLRFYDEIGLLRPAWIDRRTSYRYYTAEQLATLNRIVALKELGLSLDEIVEIARDRVPDDALRALLLDKRLAAERSLRVARAQLDRIDASLARIDAGEPASPYAIVTKPIAPRLVVSRRDGMRSYEHLLEMLDEVERHARRHRARGSRAALFHACDPEGGTLDCEALVLVDAPVPESETLRVYELPEQRVASVVHAGPLAAAPQAFAALDGWLKKSRYELDGPFLEIYLQSSRESGSVVLEIQFPLRAKSASAVH